MVASNAPTSQQNVETQSCLKICPSWCPDDVEMPPTTSENCPLLPNNSFQEGSARDTTNNESRSLISIIVNHFYPKTDYGKCDCHDKHVRKAWLIYHKWDKLANRMAKQYNLFQAIVPCLAVIGTVLLTISTLVTRNKWILSISASSILALIPILRSSFLSDEHLEKLKKCKQMAEDIKSEVFKYMAKVGDYYVEDPSSDHDSPEYKLRFAISSIKQNVLHERYIYNSQLDWFWQRIDINHDGMLSSYCKNVSSCEDKMEQIEKLHNWYIKYRVKLKIKMIKDYGKTLERREDRLKALEFAFSIGASAIALLQGSTEAGMMYGGNGSHILLVLGVFATISHTSLSSYKAAAAYGDLHVHADTVSDSLDYLILCHGGYFERYGHSQPFWEKFVKSCEDALKADANAWFNIKQKAREDAENIRAELNKKKDDQNAQEPPKK